MLDFGENATLAGGDDTQPHDVAIDAPLEDDVYDLDADEAPAADDDVGLDDKL